MGKRSSFAFYLLVVFYLLGLLAGGLYQVHIKEQAQMYEYLKNGVSGYEGSVLGSIKAVGMDNIPELLAMLLSAYLPFGLYLVGGVLLVRGFMAGFALTACLRVYGIFGGMLCIGNVLSAALTGACFILFGMFIFNNADSFGKVKLGFFSFIFLLVVLLLDSILKGTLSSIAVKLWR